VATIRGRLQRKTLSLKGHPKKIDALSRNWQALTLATFIPAAQNCVIPCHPRESGGMQESSKNKHPAKRTSDFVPLRCGSSYHLDSRLRGNDGLKD
jgi:hypothetical protein